MCLCVTNLRLCRDYSANTLANPGQCQPTAKRTYFVRDRGWLRSLLNKIVQLTGHANMVASMQVMLILCIVPNHNLIVLDYHILTSTSSQGQTLMIVESAIHCTV